MQHHNQPQSPMHSGVTKHSCKFASNSDHDLGKSCSCWRSRGFCLTTIAKVLFKGMQHGELVFLLLHHLLQQAQASCDARCLQHCLYRQPTWSISTICAHPTTVRVPQYCWCFDSSCRESIAGAELSPVPPEELAFLKGAPISAALKMQCRKIC